MTEKLVLDHPAEGVARLTISNPDRRGALDHEILDALAGHARTLEARCLVIRGSGQVFSAGYDIGNLGEQSFEESAERLVAHPFNDAIEALEAYEYPVLAALNGHAIGGGLELALTCDIRVAARGIRLGMPPAKLGLIYSHTGLRRFIDVCGVANTAELFYVGRNVDAERAERMGLVNELVEPEELDERVLDLAAEIASGAPLSLAGNKRAIRALRARPLPEDVERELVELRESCFRSEDFREGVRAFAEKRKPVWRGR
jgi:enoyl-CoA hydratase/carnithine racemase